MSRFDMLKCVLLFRTSRSNTNVENLSLLVKWKNWLIDFVLQWVHVQVRETHLCMICGFLISWTDFTPLSAICSFLSWYNLPNSVLIHHVPRSARIEHSLTWHGWRDDPSHRFKRNRWSVMTVLAGPSHPLHVFWRPLGVDVSPPWKADPGGTFARRPRSHILMSGVLSDMSPCTHNLN